jgi:hypothetical protein
MLRERFRHESGISVAANRWVVPPNPFEVPELPKMRRKDGPEYWAVEFQQLNPRIRGVLVLNFNDSDDAASEIEVNSIRLTPVPPISIEIAKPRGIKVERFRHAQVRLHEFLIAKACSTPPSRLPIARKAWPAREVGLDDPISCPSFRHSTVRR